MKNWRSRGDIRKDPSGSMKAAKNPTANEPVIFTTSVPRGKNSPPRSATNPDTQNRAPVPSAPPTITRIYSSIKKLLPLEGVISSRGFPRLTGEGKLHCLGWTLRHFYFPSNKRFNDCVLILLRHSCFV